MPNIPKLLKYSSTAIILGNQKWFCGIQKFPICQICIICVTKHEICLHVNITMGILFHKCIKEITLLQSLNDKNCTKASKICQIPKLYYTWFTELNYFVCKDCNVLKMQDGKLLFCSQPMGGTVQNQRKYDGCMQTIRVPFGWWVKHESDHSSRALP